MLASFCGRVRCNYGLAQRRPFCWFGIALRRSTPRAFFCNPPPLPLTLVAASFPITRGRQLRLCFVVTRVGSGDEREINGAETRCPRATTIKNSPVARLISGDGRQSHRTGSAPGVCRVSVWLASIAFRPACGRRKYREAVLACTWTSIWCAARGAQKRKTLGC